MSWPGTHHEYVSGPQLTHELTMRYLDLRRRRLIGMLWSDGGHFSIAPIGVDRRDCAEPISITRLITLIDSLSCPRKDVRSEAPKARAACAA